MQVLDEQKKDKILVAATKLFAAEPFHKVLLSDVAEAAGVGKGTLYIYFKSKEDLYFEVHSQGFARLLSYLHERIANSANGAAGNMEIVIREYINFAYQNPHLFELMRTLPENALGGSQREQNRTQLRNLVESLLRQGIADGQFDDPHPELTARYILGLLRSLFRGGIGKIERQVLTEHLIGFIQKGLTRHDLSADAISRQARPAALAK